MNNFVSVCLIGDYKVTGRDSLVFLVDASKEMFIKGEDGEPSNFEKTMQVRCQITCLCRIHPGNICPFVMEEVGIIILLLHQLLFFSGRLDVYYE